MWIAVWRLAFKLSKSPPTVNFIRVSTMVFAHWNFASKRAAAVGLDSFKCDSNVRLTLWRSLEQLVLLRARPLRREAFPRSTDLATASATDAINCSSKYWECSTLLLVSLGRAGTRSEQRIFSQDNIASVKNITIWNSGHTQKQRPDQMSFLKALRFGTTSREVNESTNEA